MGQASWQAEHGSPYLRAKAGIPYAVCTHANSVQTANRRIPILFRLKTPMVPPRYAQPNSATTVAGFPEEQTCIQPRERFVSMTDSQGRARFSAAASRCSCPLCGNWSAFSLAIQKLSIFDAK